MKIKRNYFCLFFHPPFRPMATFSPFSEVWRTTPNSSISPAQPPRPNPLVRLSSAQLLFPTPSSPRPLQAQPRARRAGPYGAVVRLVPDPDWGIPPSPRHPSASEPGTVRSLVLRAFKTPYRCLLPALRRPSTERRRRHRSQAPPRCPTERGSHRSAVDAGSFPEPSHTSSDGSRCLESVRTAPLPSTAAGRPGPPPMRCYRPCPAAVSPSPCSPSPPLSFPPPIRACRRPWSPETPPAGAPCGSVRLARV
jgi:hypothetical protein